MNAHLIDGLQAMGGLLAGGLIGLGFGQLQHVAWRRNQALQQAGRFNSGWAAMPGSFRRIAFLLIALALVQLGCPLLFADGREWWVSGGVLVGYGSVLCRQLLRTRTGGP